MKLIRRKYISISKVISLSYNRYFVIFCFETFGYFRKLVFMQNFWSLVESIFIYLNILEFSRLFSDFFKLHLNLDILSKNKLMHYFFSSQCGCSFFCRHTPKIRFITYVLPPFLILIFCFYV